MLDPRSTDMYFENEAEVTAAVEVIKRDGVFKNMRELAREEDGPIEIPIYLPGEARANVDVSGRRAELIARKRGLEEDRIRHEVGGAGTDKVGAKINDEISR